MLSNTHCKIQHSSGAQLVKGLFGGYSWFGCASVFTAEEAAALLSTMPGCKAVPSTSPAVVVRQTSKIDGVFSAGSSDGIYHRAE